MKRLRFTGTWMEYATDFSTTGFWNWGLTVHRAGRYLHLPPLSPSPPFPPRQPRPGAAEGSRRCSAEMSALWLRTGSGAELSSLSLFLNGASSSTVRAPAFNGSRRRRHLRVASLRSYLPRGKFRALRCVCINIYVYIVRYKDICLGRWFARMKCDWDMKLWTFKRVILGGYYYVSLSILLMAS